MRAADRPHDLEALLVGCRNGDQAAWSRLVDRYNPLVYSIARKYGLREDDAGDVFVRTFERFLGSLDRIESGSVIGRWLAVTAARESLRLLRTNSRHSTSNADELGLDELIAAEDASAEAMSIEADEAFRARTALAQLPPRCRTLLTLLYTEEDLAYAEIAERAGVPIGAIGPTRARCLAKLRGILGESGFFE